MLQAAVNTRWAAGWRGKAEQSSGSTFACPRRMSFNSAKWPSVKTYAKGYNTKY
jgi:hypothetical protein